MKKNLFYSVIISGIITVLISGINYVFATLFKFLPFGISLTGGDCVEHIGIGVDMLVVYPLTMDGGYTTDVSLSFDWITALICFVIMTGFMFLSLTILKGVLDRRKKS